jgi:hypothetical protein
MTKNIEFTTTISEAETTLADLITQLESADGQEAALNTDSEALAFEAYTKGGVAKTKLETLQKEIAAAQGRQHMIRVAITQAKAILAHARAVEADRLAREKATQARGIAASLPTIGSEMDKGLDAIITGFKKIQEVHVALAQLGYPTPPSLDHFVIRYLQTILCREGIDLAANLGQAERGSNFATILAAQEQYSRTKTGVVLEAETGICVGILEAAKPETRAARLAH